MLTLALALLACAPKPTSVEPAPAVEAAPAEAPAAEPEAFDYGAVVAAPDRLQADRDMDEIRQPEAWLDHFGVAPGMHVLELGAGGGYSTELLSRVVGPEGRVYSQNPAEWAQWSVEPWAQRSEGRPLENVVRLERPFDDPLPAEASALDMALFILVYHDVATLDADRAKMNARLFEALKPGGLLGVIDHHAPEGAGVSMVNETHRIEEAAVREELEAAGFVFVSSADFMGYPEDPRTEMAFARPQPRTDRFVLTFVKPPVAPQE